MRCSCSKQKKWSRRKKKSLLKSVRGIAGHRRAIRHLFRHPSARTNKGTVADRDAGQNDRVRADRCTGLYECGNDLPITTHSHCSIIVDGFRMFVVGEHDTVADKNAVFDGYPFTNE